MSEKRTRNNRLTLRLTDDELKIFDEKLKKTGLSQQAFLYKMVFENYIAIIDFKEIAALRNEFNKIGININQITRKVNETQVLEKSELAIMNKLVREANERVDDVVREILRED